MTCTFDDITRWLDEAAHTGATHLIIGLDTFDHDNFPIYVMPGECPKERYDKLYADGNAADEVYNMRMNLDRQRREFRALNF